MPDTWTDLVIQISASVADANGKNAEADANCAVAELRRCLKPGTEIGLVFRGYMAITSILWVSGPPADRSLRAGVRFVGVSALREERPQQASLVELPRTIVPT